MKTECSPNVDHAAGFLAEGKLVSIPTETVYGLAANGFRESALKEVFRVKQRPFYDPLILHTDSLEKVEQWTLNMSPHLRKLADAFWPGPLTLLLERSEAISDVVTAGLPRVAFRIPEHPLTLDLLARLDFPLAAPSANPFGYVSPTQASHVMHHFDGAIAMVLDGGPCQVGIESTIVGEEDGELIVYRLGGLALEEIEKVVGSITVRDSSSKPSAPGMLERHYSPGKQIHVVESQEELNAQKSDRAAFILFGLGLSDAKPSRLIQLSSANDPKEAAANFYAALRHWEDDEAVTELIIERMPDFDLGRAINDRLRRAAHR